MEDKLKAINMKRGFEVTSTDNTLLEPEQNYSFSSQYGPPKYLIQFLTQSRLKLRQ